MNRTLDEFAVLLKHQFHGKNISSQLFGSTLIKYCFTYLLEIFLTLPFPGFFPGSEF